VGRNYKRIKNMKSINERIRENIIRDYGKIQNKLELEKHISQHQEHKANLFENYIAQYFPKDFFKNKKVLEIGCGFGGNIIHLTQNYNCDAIGLDLDSDAIEIAQEIAQENGIDKNKFLNCAAENVTTYVKDKFDLIISMQVLEHVQDVQKSIEEMLSLLNKGGYIFIHVPNYDSKFETHYRLKMPSNKKSDFINLLKEKNIDIDFAESLNFVNKQYFIEILKEITFEKSFILPYEQDSYRKYFRLSQKYYLLNLFPFVGRILRNIKYNFYVPDSIVVVLKK